MEALSKSDETKQELKPWQKGFELDYLKDLEKRFDSYNKFAQHELSKFKKNNIAEALSKDQIQLLGRGLIHYTKTKVKSNIFMFPGVLLGTKQPGDINIKHFGYKTEDDIKNIITELKENTEYTTNNVWLFINEESQQDKSIADKAGFKKIGVKYNSVADIIGVYYKDAESKFEDTQHPKVPVYEKYTLKPFALDFSDITPLIAKQLEEMEIEFTNHYSNYNKGNTWKGMVVRGYGGLVDFIVKPAEMVNSWKKENKEKMDWKVKDTPLRKQLPAVEKFADILGDYEHERIRILMLKEGEGELERHTDRQDVEAGIGDGQWARLHFPLQTNPKVEFKQWNADGTSTKCKMGEGELWYLEMRKPHTAVNFGEQDRYHLIIDVKSDQRLRDWLVRSSEKYPSTKQVDDYIE